MRVLIPTLVGTLALAGLSISAQPAAPDKASAVLAAAREALGGEKKLSAVKTIVATGRTRQVRGDNLVPIEFEIAMELPDKYVRKDEIPAQESDPSTVGFNGADLIQFPVPIVPTLPTMPARAGGPPAPTAATLEAARVARLTNVRQDFARLTLGLFASSFSSVPLTFSYAGVAEAPQGKADVLDFKGAGTFSGRVFINSETHVPIMVTWTAPAPPQRGGRPGGPPSPSAGPAAVPPGPPPESRLFYADYREVGGVQFPFRLRRAVGPDTIEETTFDGFKINGKIDPRKFLVRQ
jgi:hypothetical protein